MTVGGDGADARHDLLFRRLIDQFEPVLDVLLDAQEGAARTGRCFRVREDLGQVLRIGPEAVLVTSHHVARVRERRRPGGIDGAEDVVGVGVGEEDRVDRARLDARRGERLARHPGAGER